MVGLAGMPNSQSMSVQPAIAKGFAAIEESVTLHATTVGAIVRKSLLAQNANADPGEEILQPGSLNSGLP
jgi:hypothetical protein